VGLGSFAEHWDALAEAGVPIYLSAMSSKARRVTPDLRDGKIEMKKPEELLELVLWAERTLFY
jgi:hypothetical protein